VRAQNAFVRLAKKSVSPGRNEGRFFRGGGKEEGMNKTHKAVVQGDPPWRKIKRWKLRGDGAWTLGGEKVCRKPTTSNPLKPTPRPGKTKIQKSRIQTPLASSNPKTSVRVEPRPLPPDCPDAKKGKTASVVHPEVRIRCDPFWKKKKNELHELQHTTDQIKPACLGR